MNKTRVLFVSLFVLLFAGAQVAFGAVQAFKITNNSGASRSDLHLEFTGTGGTAKLVVFTNAPGCTAPTVSNPGTPWDIVWSSACVDNGEFIEVKIISDVGGVAFSSGHWTPGNVALAGGDVTEIVPPTVPALSEWGMIILGILILAGGVVFIMRRRTGRVAA